jgi:endonuclease YncB( thermonuclease family)
VSSATVQSVTDGDTIRLSQPFMGTTSVRMLNIDAPELNGGTQEPWAAEARRTLIELLPAGTPVTLETERTITDAFGRLLAHVVRTEDGVNVNVEQVRLGRALLYALWPNAERFEQYREAQREAQRGGRGVWDRTRPLEEWPFEYRRRTGGGSYTRPTGDTITRFVVNPQDYARVSAHNRLFFDTWAEAEGAGYRRCPREGSEYAAFCFAP